MPNNKMLSTPAYVASIAYLVLLVIILLTPGVTSTAATPSSTFGSRVMFVIFMLIPIALSVYSINCYVIGGCYVWSWLNVVGIVIWVLLFGLSILSFHSARKNAILHEAETRERFSGEWQVSAHKK